MKSVCVVTGTRAEFGLLLPIIRKVMEDSDLELRLAVTGAHLSKSYGETYKEIDTPIHVKIPILKVDNGKEDSITDATAAAVKGFGDYFKRFPPDIVVLLGDRYEIIGAATAAMLTKVPIAHLHGGELTLGAVDDAIRHAVTKMSYLHFTSTEEYRRRVIQLGEMPNRVKNVGALGVENIKTQELMPLDELLNSIGLAQPYFLITFHPETMSRQTPREQIETLLRALDQRGDMNLLFTKANADEGGMIINDIIDEYVSKNRQRAAVFYSLGQLRYLSAMKYCAAVVGNTSSGILEAPSMHVPTVNIGNRQAGRIRAQSVIDCGLNEMSILEALNQARSSGFIEACRNATNPYEGKNTSARIIEAIKKALYQDEINLMKRFCDFDVNLEDSDDFRSDQ